MLDDNPIIFKLLSNWLNVTKFLHKAQQEKNYIFQQKSSYKSLHYTKNFSNKIENKCSAHPGFSL